MTLKSSKTKGVPSEKPPSLREKVKSTPSLDWDDLRRRSLEPGGFGDSRVNLWPQLLNASSTSRVSRQPDKTDTDLKNEDQTLHRDERQIKLDTDRSFVLYPVGINRDTAREKLQGELHDLLVSLFRKRPKLSYFQGYHDIISVLFLTLPSDIQLVCAEKISLHRVRDSMGSSLEPVLGLLRITKNLLRLVDPQYTAVLEQNSPLPFYALSNLLTLFSHDMPTLPLIQHVFDYLLCRPPITTVYLATALILTRKEEVYRLHSEGEEGMMHSLLTGLPDIADEVVNRDEYEPLEEKMMEERLEQDTDPLELVPESVDKKIELSVPISATLPTRPLDPSVDSIEDQAPVAHTHVLEEQSILLTTGAGARPYGDSHTEDVEGKLESLTEQDASGAIEQDISIIEPPSTLAGTFEGANELLERNPEISITASTMGERDMDEPTGDRISGDTVETLSTFDKNPEISLTASSMEGMDGEEPKSRQAPVDTGETLSSHQNPEIPITATATGEEDADLPVLPPVPTGVDGKGVDSDLAPGPASNLPSRASTPDPLAAPRPKVALTSLLMLADALYEKHPPSDPGLSVSSIMGPQSVVFTWSEDFSVLPSDDMAEAMVTRPELVVYPFIEDDADIESSMEEEASYGKKEKRKRRKLRKSRFNKMEKRTMITGAVIVLGVAMAVYGMKTRAGTGMYEVHHVHAQREQLKRLGGWASGVLVGIGAKLLGGLKG
ncbi:rab-GTPase-TBC domain-containing protein [Cyathus striatus]|nr:rab-GTPase-TBC domain-containing protein [Cyathus striatus]